MKWRVERRPDVDLDIIGIAVYLHEKDEALSDRFVDATEQTIRTLAKMPHVGSPKAFRAIRLTGLRSWRIEGFPKHLIFYRIDGRTINLVAVVHGARDLPRSLGRRLK